MEHLATYPGTRSSINQVPWTRQQVKYLLSSGSPLTSQQQTKMKGELHANPAMGHKKKGSAALKKSAKFYGR